MPQRDYASKKYALKGLCLKGTPSNSYAKRGRASKKYALKGLCLKKLCPKGTVPPKTMPFYCTTGITTLNSNDLRVLYPSF